MSDPDTNKEIHILNLENRIKREYDFYRYILSPLEFTSLVRRACDKIENENMDEEWIDTSEYIPEARDIQKLLKEIEEDPSIVRGKGTFQRHIEKKVKEDKYPKEYLKTREFAMLWKKIKEKSPQCTKGKKILS